MWIQFVSWRVGTSPCAMSILCEGGGGGGGTVEEQERDFFGR